MGWGNPWRELRRREHIVFRLAELPAGIDAVYWPRGCRAAVIVDCRLSRVQRRAALAHELVHDDRGGGVKVDGMPATWSAIVVREEAAVDDEVARRLVPLDDLANLVDALTAMELPVEVWEVAEQFDVPDSVAARAMRLLKERDGGGRDELHPAT